MSWRGCKRRGGELMIQAFYSAAVGAQQQMQKMNVQANNIANVNTCGFKAEKPAFQALMYGMVNGCLLYTSPSPRDA